LFGPITPQDGTYKVLLSGTGPEPTVTIESRLPFQFQFLGAIVEFKGPTS
jgi:hypothetical protein